MTVTTVTTVSQDPKRTGRVRIRDLLSSQILPDLRPGGLWGWGGKGGRNLSKIWEIRCRSGKMTNLRNPGDFRIRHCDFACKHMGFAGFISLSRLGLEICRFLKETSTNICAIKSWPIGFPRNWSYSSIHRGMFGIPGRTDTT